MGFLKKPKHVPFLEICSLVTATACISDGLSSPTWKILRLFQRRDGGQHKSTECDLRQSKKAGVRKPINTGEVRYKIGTS